MARRFLCPPDPAWQAVQDVLRAAGLLTAVLAVLLQLTSPFCTLMVIAAGLLAAALWVTDRQVRVRAESPLAASLRWDGEQWWWEPAAATDAAAKHAATTDVPAKHAVTTDAAAKHAAAGEPLANATPAGIDPGRPAVAVTPHVLLDGEHWLLLRLVPIGSEGRFWRHSCLAVSRRQQAGHWSLLRIHLFMART
ncbi:hypothetical protein [Roseateles depolymerans]|uniref:Uncharacterized protein n=1 Tax=Roseateles depolymerans TaxID=76731 RepID=A0A0U3E5B2_9BURK|nr:hypothetical protein [Roseateles depolymerans]ALV08469.1 hypothetical protein RD2015_4020 [Roseateles depolymerans]REG21305.1 hypothetical protein DES44_0419 [Roseateles depolymerans]